MTKPIPYRRLARSLRRHGCQGRPGKGDHEIWTCACGASHRAVVTKPGDVSPGVVADVIKKLECLPKGWWNE